MACRLKEDSHYSPSSFSLPLEADPRALHAAASRWSVWKQASVNTFALWCLHSSV